MYAECVSLQKLNLLRTSEYSFKVQLFDTEYDKKAKKNDLARDVQRIYETQLQLSCSQ